MLVRSTIRETMTQMNRWLQFVDKRRMRPRVVVGNNAESRESVRRIDRAIRTVPPELVVQMGYEEAMRRWMLPDDFAVWQERRKHNVLFPADYEFHVECERREAKA